METIEWFKPHGYKTLTNSEGMEIMIDPSAEEVSYRFSNDNIVHDSFIRYDQDGDPYFMEKYRDVVHYLNEFIKIQ